MCSEEDRPNSKSRLQCVQKKIDPMQNRSCHVFRRRSISFVNAVIFRFQNLNTHKCYVIFNLRQTLSRFGIAILLLCAGMDAPLSLYSPHSQCRKRHGKKRRCSQYCHSVQVMMSDRQCRKRQRRAEDGDGARFFIFCRHRELHPPAH